VLAAEAAGVRRLVQLRDGPGLRPRRRGGRSSARRGLPAMVGRPGKPRPAARQGRAAVHPAASGDLYRKSYQGLYCTDCEQFYRPAELDGGRCPEHGTAPEAVSEENWFFRLSRYAGQLKEEITSGRLRIEPAARRHEVLAFIGGGLEDFSASRPASRAGGWGYPCRRPGPGHLRLVGRARQLHTSLSWLVTGRRRRRSGAGGPGPASGSTWPAACCGSTRSIGKPCCCPPGCPCPPRFTCTTT
jgi:hypothetical protein